MTEISKLHTLAGQITQRWQTDLQKIQYYAENVFKDLANLNDRLNNEITIHIQLEQIRNLRNYIHILLRTISFSTQEILNVELIKQKELDEIVNYLHIIHSHDEIASDLPTLLEIIKVNLMFTSKTLYCTLKVPILADELYHLSKIIPIPSKNDNILLPPYTFTLNSKGLTKWTSEECIKTFSFWYCQKMPHEDPCSLDNLSQCNYARVNNNFSIFTQLTNGHTIICTKQPEDINEDCYKTFKSAKITKCNVVLGKNDCLYSFQKHTWTGTNRTFTQEWPNSQEPPNIRHQVNITPLHLEDPTKLLPQYQEPNLLPIEFHQGHIGVSVVSVIIIIGVIIYLFRRQIKKKSRTSVTIEVPLDEGELPSSLLKPKSRGRAFN